MGQLDKMIKKAEEAQERRSQQQSGEATVSPPPVVNQEQEHVDVPATVVTQSQTQPTQAEPVPEASTNSPSWWKRVRDRFSSGGRVRRDDKSSKAAEKPVEPTSPTEGSVSPMFPERMQACSDMVGIRQEIAAYETAINANDRIIMDIQKLYDDDKEYIREVTDMTKAVDHHRLATTNQLAKANIEVLARNLYALPSVSRMADKDIIKAQEAVRAEKAAQVDEVTAEVEKTQQEEKKEVKQTPPPSPKQEAKPQTASPSPSSIKPILKDVALAVLFFLVIALGGAYFTGHSAKKVSYAGNPDALSTIDSLKAVIASQKKELADIKGADVNYLLLRLKYDKMAKLKAHEQADAIFRNFDDFNDLLRQNKQLLKEKVRLQLEVEDWAKAYDQMKVIVDANAPKGKAGAQEPEQPKRGKSAFNSIETEKNNSPYSPQSF
ncbi:MAG: hypothetical protein IJ647_05450 [Prevotella sp.]|nr:hypothetical protein [Prevotella sp.]